MTELSCSGAILEVDLTEGRAERRPTPASLVLDYLGGRGLGARLLWSLAPGTAPEAPETPLLFCPGLLNPYPLPAKPRCVVVSKSPLTRPLRPRFPGSSTLTYSNLGGFFGPELKYAGLDALAVRGRASSPTILVIDDDTTRFEQATTLWGASVKDTDQALRERFGPEFQTICIGPAGEAGVRFASIMHEVSRAFGRGGAGYVMGQKQLKAIAVRGTRLPGVADYGAYCDARTELREHFRGQKDTRPYVNRQRYGTLFSLGWVGSMGALSVRNFTAGAWDEMTGYAQRAEADFVHHHSCYACPIACHKSSLIRSGPGRGHCHDGSHFEHAGMLGAHCGLSSEKLIPKLSETCNDLGLDVISMGNLLGFLMDARERGWLPEGFLGDVRLDWGDFQGMLTLVEQTGRRQGVGRILADGVAAVAKALGPQAQGIAYHGKGMEYPAWNPKGFAPMGLSYATSTRGACHIFGQAKGGQNGQAMLDSLGDCMLARAMTPRPLLGRLVSAVLGQPCGPGALFSIGDRTINLEKCFNWREGFDRQDDEAHGAALVSEPISRAAQPMTAGWLSGQLAAYYALRRWDRDTSRPSRQILTQLKLDFAIEELDF